MKNLKYIAAIILLFMFIKCVTSTSDETIVNSDKAPEWYTGGTLHKSRISDWKKATEENKLATCADFIANTSKNASMEEIRIKAENLRSCINEATKGTNQSDNEKITDIAGLCLITMK